MWNLKVNGPQQQYAYETGQKYVISCKILQGQENSMPSCGC